MDSIKRLVSAVPSSAVTSTQVATAYEILSQAEALAGRKVPTHVRSSAWDFAIDAVLNGDPVGDAAEMLHSFIVDQARVEGHRAQWDRAEGWDRRGTARIRKVAA